MELVFQHLLSVRLCIICFAMTIITLGGFGVESANLQSIDKEKPSMSTHHVIFQQDELIKNLTKRVENLEVCICIMLLARL